MNHIKYCGHWSPQTADIHSKAALNSILWLHHRWIMIMLCCIFLAAEGLKMFVKSLLFLLYPCRRINSLLWDSMIIYCGGWWIVDIADAAKQQDSFIRYVSNNIIAYYWKFYWLNRSMWPYVTSHIHVYHNTEVMYTQSKSTQHRPCTMVLLAHHHSLLVLWGVTFCCSSTISAA